MSAPVRCSDEQLSQALCDCHGTHPGFVAARLIGVGTKAKAEMDSLP